MESAPHFAVTSGPHRPLSSTSFGWINPPALMGTISCSTFSVPLSLCSHLLPFEGYRNFLFNWPVVTAPFQVVF